MKFSVGEVVVYVGPNKKYVGEEAEIIAVGPFPAWSMRDPRDGRINNSPADYLIKFSGSASGFTIEASLRKRPYKDQHTPAEQSFPELISSLKGVSA